MTCCQLYIKALKIGCLETKTSKTTCFSHRVKTIQLGEMNNTSHSRETFEQQPLSLFFYIWEKFCALKGNLIKFGQSPLLNTFSFRWWQETRNSEKIKHLKWPITISLLWRRKCKVKEMYTFNNNFYREIIFLPVTVYYSTIFRLSNSIFPTKPVILCFLNSSPLTGHFTSLINIHVPSTSRIYKTSLLN